MKAQRGFTLIEVMIVVVVIAILTAIAYPSYLQYVIRGKLPEAFSALSDGRVKMEQFYQDNRTYQNGPTPAATTNFNYVAVGNATTYTITANGKNNVTGFSYTINQDNTKTSTTSWGNSASCWVNRKGGGC